MVTNIYCMVIKSLQRQLDQITMQQNEENNVIEEEFLCVNDATQFYIPKRIQNIMPRIHKTKEQLIGYRTLFATIMEPRKTFISKIMKRPNIQMRLLMKEEPIDIELEGWGGNANKVTLANL